MVRAATAERVQTRELTVPAQEGRLWGEVFELLDAE